MAIKDWKKYAWGYDYVIYKKNKKKVSIFVDYPPRVEINTKEHVFESKSKALKFARAYMEKN
jgi:hypothetical protein